MTELGLVESNRDFGTPVGFSLENPKNALILTIIGAIVSAALLALSIYGTINGLAHHDLAGLVAYFGVAVSGAFLIVATIFSISLAEEVQNTHEGYARITS